MSIEPFMLLSLGLLIFGRRITDYIGSDCGYGIAVLDTVGNKSIEALSRDIAKGSRCFRLIRKRAKAE